MTLVEPIINLDDPVGKTVGRRAAPEDSLGYGLNLQKTLNEMIRLPFPKGVYRFHSHEEADEWMMTHLTKSRKG
ncbi:MAG: hypothetical protein ACOYMS_05250 [Terrimicrobiaceae bacterium]